MEGKEVYGRSFYGGEEQLILGALGFVERSEILGVGLYQSGTGVAGGFGHRGQDIHMISWS
jgi:hypothetical protein